MVRVNDIVPATSGKSGLGLALGTQDGQIGQLGLGLTFLDLYPFFHVHCLSGVYHDPLLGTSGVIRFGKSTTPRLEKSVDGGLTFTALFSQRTSTLQLGYEKDRNLYITNAEGPVRLVGINRKVQFDSYSVVAPINFSGAIPVNTANPGDLLMLSHSVASGTPISLAEQNTAILRARSLGVGTLMLNTGSGIVNISIGSGLAQFRSTSAVGVSTTSNSGSCIATSTPDFSDLNNHQGNVGQIGPVVPPRSFWIWSPGLYECSYHVSFDKTAGNDPHVIKCQMFRNIIEPIKRSESYVFAATTAAGEGTCHATFLMEAKAGDCFNIQCGYEGGVTASNTSSSIANEGYVLIKKIGDRRHEAAIIFV